MHFANEKWQTALHKAADMIHDCIDSGYIECVGDSSCELVRMTPAGSEVCCPYYLLKQVVSDFRVAVKFYL